MRFYCYHSVLIIQKYALFEYVYQIVEEPKIYKSRVIINLY